jgi:hypothetical protein
MVKIDKFLFLFVLLVAFAATGEAQSNGAAMQGKAVFLIMGDSVMKLVSARLESDLAQNPAFRPVSFTSLGSGLSRPDLLDWHAKIKTLVEINKPSAAVMIIGLVDNQAMQTEKGVLQYGSAEWQAEYARRVAKCMDIMIQGGVKNIIWIALPDVREPDRQEHVLMINKIFSNEAASRPAVVILDTQKIFSREPGKYTAYIAGPDGTPINVRTSDSHHFTRDGASHLAAIIIKKLNEVLKKQ